MKRWLVGFALALGALSAPAQVGIPQQQEGTPSLSTGTVPLTYTGGDSRVSVGVDQDGHSNGELLGVFGNNGEHAFVAQLWWGQAGAGGIQGDYNWLFGTTLEQARADPDSITVAKLSFAIDQNAEKDRQANVGLSIERKEFFLNFFLSGKVSAAHDAGTVSTQTQSVVTGTDTVGTFTQTQTDVATTLLQAQPYSYTAGVHGGHFSDALAARFNGGIDYAKGHEGASQTRISVGIDKYLGTRGWSVSGVAEHAQNNDPLGISSSDNRWWLFLRYEFGGGGAFRPLADSSAADAAWINRALHEPVTGHPRTFDTYTTRGPTTTKTAQGPKQYTARFPIARDDSASVSENSTGNTVDVLANDTDPDGNALSISAVGSPSHGTAQISGTQVLYTPTSGYVGSDVFPYTITNTKGLTASAKVQITVTAVVVTPPPTNQGPPVARDDTATTPYATPVTINVLANDSDPSGYTLTVTGTTPPAHGTARINADNSITYTPNSTYSGNDRFSYSISNGHGGSASANVILTVQPPLPPVARDDAATTPYLTPVVVDVLANDTDPNGFFLSVTSVGVATNGTAKILPGGAVNYSPQPGFVGSDSFEYSISDGHGGIASANVIVTVQPPGGSLTAQNDTATTPYAKPVAINVIANDTAPSGLALSITKVTLPTHGTAQVAINGYIGYTPSQAFDGGSDTFDYTVTDGLTTATATVTVTVLPPPPPVAQNDSATTPFQTPVAINVLANDSDPSGLPLTVTQATVQTSGSGTVKINTNNTITYTPDIEFDGNATFSYTISNGHGGTATATVTVNVLAPLPPIAGPDSATTPFNKSVTINVLANDSDPRSLPLTILQPGFPLHGTAVLNTNNTITYTPQSTFQGIDTFIYVLQNSQGATANGNVTVTVQAPLPPIAVPDTKTTAFNTPTDIDVLANDSDPNGLPLSIMSFTQPTAGGSVQANTNNTLRFTPTSNFTGDATFTYTIADSYNQASATVTVTVQPPPAATAVDFVVPTAAGCSYGGEICAVCLDTHVTNPSNLILTWSVSPTTPGGGNVFITNIGSCTSGEGVQYQSSASSKPGDSDSFTFTVKDIYNRSSTGTASLVFN
jgi:hypothetical protein